MLRCPARPPSIVRLGCNECRQRFWSNSTCLSIRQHRPLEPLVFYLFYFVSTPLPHFHHHGNASTHPTTIIKDDVRQMEARDACTSRPLVCIFIFIPFFLLMIS